jgi:hypothetical protein
LAADPAAIELVDLVADVRDDPLQLADQSLDLELAIQTAALVLRAATARTWIVASDRHRDAT